MPRQHWAQDTEQRHSNQKTQHRKLTTDEQHESNKNGYELFMRAIAMI
jgi:hypothetical protein